MSDLLSRHYILDGITPIPAPDVLTWARWFAANAETRLVARTFLTETVHVSTIFLALDHQLGSGPPLLFESMSFALAFLAIDQLCERCATWGEAEQMHEKIVTYIQEYLAMESVHDRHP